MWHKIRKDESKGDNDKKIEFDLFYFAHMAMSKERQLRLPSNFLCVRRQWPVLLHEDSGRCSLQDGGEETHLVSDVIMEHHPVLLLQRNPEIKVYSTP